MRFSLHERPDGVETGAGRRVVYDLERKEAHLGAASVDGPALVWELGGDDAGAALAVDVEVGAGWLVRCDRIDFPPGGIAYRHVHPGPGIRRLLRGELTIDADGGLRTYGPGEWWYESGPEPVFAAASPDEDTAFVRVMLVPRELEGQRTIRYVDAADEERPRLQRATVLLEAPL